MTDIEQQPELKTEMNTATDPDAQPTWDANTDLSGLKGVTIPSTAPSFNEDPRRGRHWSPDNAIQADDDSLRNIFASLDAMPALRHGSGTVPNIMFSSNDTPPEEFKLANDLGAIINLDDITHIQCLEDTLGFIPETISCRFNPGGVFKISNDIMDNPGDAKYGMTTEQIFEAFKILKSKGAKNFGIHAFLASNTVTNEYYPMLAKILFELAVKLKEETGAHISFINLSGGIGIPYRPDQEPNDIMAIGEGVRKVYEEVLVPAGMDDVALCTELGRFMLGPYGCLVTKAIHEKHTHKEYIGVDACAVNLMRPAMYGAYHHITVLGKEDVPCDHKYDITGSLCENNDKFAIDRMLPEIKMGDFLVIHDAGAHGFAMGYNYNGKLKSAELIKGRRFCSDDPPCRNSKGLLCNL